MSKTISYPSVDFPGPPRLSLDVPDDWETLTVPGVQVAVAQPRVEGRFRANVVVTVQRFGPEFSLEAARAGLEQRKAGLPELEELGTGEITIDEIAWIASEYGYTQPGRPTVVQAARYAVIDRAGVATDVVEIVGSCGAEHAEDEIELVRSIQDSVHVTID
ncbi:hypothetical protein M3C58_11400 [Brachybacterium muris]|uniref:hypothetical protein n=1 Tax=Brachybacterium muris TaxID=219301 RepID=UPI00223BF432|nr:hypothetical protein [Brachybacterium muris]MCT1655289.1 hypothetical protein [Brachybacterium muris]MCT1998792.1 hypothetical protein [Brachybacterium muris]MCT2262555.1 hypothetical protein [Brachybacterium muris]MCT2296360.1 hypothetical protein [Brachybacterium muris]